MERTLLLVDDEENIVRSLNRLFRHDGYTIETAASGEEGLRRLAEQPVNVIISDQRMPHMTGVEFLRRVKDLYPNTVRIVLSGYTELESVTSAINEGAIYKFFTKPWDDELLRKNIRAAFEHFELEDENRRLAEQLRLANLELVTLNQNLERRVQEKTHEVMINLQALKIAQEVLEHLPVGVVGIDSEGMLVVSNSCAQRMLEQCGTSPVGSLAESVLPRAAMDALRAFPGDVEQWRFGALECRGVRCDITISQLDPHTRGKGLVLAMVPLEEV
jgi:response regulator RpfG family c-di-GMP phosphodiesterase